MNIKDLINKMHLLEVYRNKSPTNKKDIQIVFQDIMKMFSEQHCGEAYFITVGLAKRSCIEDEWRNFSLLMTPLYDILSKQFLCAGFVMGIEMYVKNRNRLNSKSFRPHAHIVFFAFNDFISGPKELIRQQLRSLGFDVKLDSLQNPRDTANALRYTIKSANTPILNQATQIFFDTKPVILGANTNLDFNPVTQIKDYLESYTNINYTFIKGQIFIQFPSTRRFTDIKYSMAELVRNICIDQQVGFYNNFLMKRIPNSRYTWVKWKSIVLFMDMLSQYQLPQQYKANMLDSAKWIINEGGDSKLGPIHSIFPRIILTPYLWEFQSGHVYNFQTGKLELLEPSAFVSCSKYQPINWDDIPMPFKIYSIIIKLYNKDDFQKLLIAMGSLFHTLQGSRKKHKSIWLVGPNNTYKSWFIRTFLKNCFHDLLIHLVPQKPSNFQFSRLINAEDGIIFIDDFRSQQFNDPAMLINLLDGVTVPIEEKYAPSKDVSLKSHFVITSNESIMNTDYKSIDRKALDARFQQVQFNLPEPNYQAQIDSINHSQWVAFAIQCNYYYLISKNFNPDYIDLPDNWCFVEYPDCPIYTLSDLFLH